MIQNSSLFSDYISFSQMRSDIVEDLLQTNAIRAFGFSKERSWFVRTHEASFLSSWVIFQEWRDWCSAIISCSKGDYWKEFISTSSGNRFKNLKMSIANYHLQLTYPSQKTVNDYKHLNWVNSHTMILSDSSRFIEEKVLPLLKLWKKNAGENKEYRRFLTGPETFMMCEGMAWSTEVKLIGPISSKGVLKRELIVCQEDNTGKIQGLAFISILDKEIFLNTLVTNPSNIRSSRNPLYERCHGVGSFIIQHIFKRCMQEQKDLTMNAIDDSHDFYKKCGLNPYTYRTTVEEIRKLCDAKRAV